MLSNKSIIEKADIAVSDLVSGGGYLNTIQASTFIRMLIDQPTVINEIRTVPMNAPKMEINKIGFQSRIMRAAPASGTALTATQRVKPTTDKVTLNTVEVIAEIHIPYDVIEDNIERGNLEDTIMTLLAERAALDLEELIIMGDTSIGSADAYLDLLDGILVQATSNIVDYSSAPAAITKTIFKDGIKAMPNKFLRNRGAMKFYVSPDVDTEYADSLANRQTILGDQKTVGLAPNYAYGVPVAPAALMPNSKYIFTYPKNVIFGVQRQIMIETDRDIRTRVLIVVMTMRIDCKYEEEEAVVKCIGLEPNLTTTTTTTTTA
jgi:HK97 family phage major capsid protein